MNTKFKEDDLVQLLNGDGTPYKVDAVMHYSEIGDIPSQYQNDLYNLYAFRGELGQFHMRWEKDLEPWVPSTSIEKWVALKLEKRWPHYKAWKAAADRSGITVEQFIMKYDGLDYIMERL